MGGEMEAYVLVQVQVGLGSEVARRIGRIVGIQRSDLVTGPYDVIARGRAGSVDEFSDTVLRRIQEIGGVTRTMTCPILHI